MNFENKITSREISQLLWEREETLSTAESCTGGRIAEAVIAVPGASKYFKGGIISYVDEIKEQLLDVDHDVIEANTAVCEEVAIQMVKGACHKLNTTYAIAATGFAGPGGGTKEVPVGTIWLACGNESKVVTMQMTEDDGRDKNLQNATNAALQMFLDYLKALEEPSEEDI
ncbi:MAG: CinA family protein [Prevotella sp.]|nr:CinA family protein [Prevotella sp.]MDD6816961.1 CinA family protein [Prevotellaceae bacterium]MCI6558340.1 CinA family protein [Prevotella sp.]MCI7045939.1 CinA family protein [Prevotella sp.]MDD6842838.1 CinA family protein [Prevotellaceae bacterium]